MRLIGIIIICFGMILFSCRTDIIVSGDYLENARIMGTVVLIDRPTSNSVKARIETSTLAITGERDGTFCMEGEACPGDTIQLMISKDGYRPVTVEVEISRNTTYTGTVVLYPYTTSWGN
jgi:hypothetical protein